MVSLLEESGTGVYGARFEALQTGAQRLQRVVQRGVLVRLVMRLQSSSLGLESPQMETDMMHMVMFHGGCVCRCFNVSRWATRCQAWKRNVWGAHGQASDRGVLYVVVRSQVSLL